MNNLEEQKEKLNEVLSMLKNVDGYYEEPILMIGKDHDNFGNYIILVGDDTEIRYSGDDKFYCFNYHDEDAPIELMTKEEIIDYYAGQYSAYGVPMIHHHKNYEYGKSYHYCKGFYETMFNLMFDLKQQIDEYESENK